mmetsp:Transcript_8070/g.10308  ORF Transcript_8070/g.10308 Transcript_8070/m.10308 type:complete len:133 (-) Transcript_8070:773-1171(-)
MLLLVMFSSREGAHTLVGGFMSVGGGGIIILSGSGTISIRAGVLFLATSFATSIPTTSASEINAPAMAKLNRFADSLLEFVLASELEEGAGAPKPMEVRAASGLSPSSSLIVLRLSVKAVRILPLEEKKFLT